MMHDDDIPLDEHRIRQLLSAQAPQWAALPIHRFQSTGTDNALFRLGEKLVLRLPRRKSTALYLTKELNWLPYLSDLSLQVPKLRMRGKTDFGPGVEFGVFDWLDGQVASPENMGDPVAAAVALAAFLKSLHQLSTVGAPLAGEQNNRRGVMLDALTQVTMRSIDILADEIDVNRAGAIWHSASSTPYAGPPVWLHGDLKADNLIARNGKLRGVLDWGLSGVGDPAVDYAAAWSWIDPIACNVFRDGCDCNESDWHRAEGWALYGAVIALSYYRGGRNEAACRQSRLNLSRLQLLL